MLSYLGRIFNLIISQRTISTYVACVQLYLGRAIEELIDGQFFSQCKPNSPTCKRKMFSNIFHFYLVDKWHPDQGAFSCLLLAQYLVRLTSKTQRNSNEVLFIFLNKEEHPCKYRKTRFIFTCFYIYISPSCKR